MLKWLMDILKAKDPYISVRNNTSVKAPVAEPRPNIGDFRIVELNNGRFKLQKYVYGEMGYKRSTPHQWFTQHESADLAYLQGRRDMEIRDTEVANKTQEQEEFLKSIKRIVE